MDRERAGGPSWGERLRYRFDLLLSRGSATTIGWVAALAVALTFLGGLAFWVIDFGGPGPIEAFWQAFLTVMGYGGIADEGWPRRLTSFSLVLASVFLTGSLIALLVTAVNKRLDALRRGQGKVLEQNHAVILGWSPRLRPVLDELLAGEHPSGRVSVVVLADRDKQSMEDDFRATHPGKDRTRVLFRSGDPSKQSDLEMVATDRAGSVIVLSEGSFVDAIAVQRALAAHACAPTTIRVVAEMTNPRVARSLTSSTSKDVVTVTVNGVVSDMLAQAIRTRGMAKVFDQLLSFEGSELYVCKPGAAAGQRFARVACGADGLVVLGTLAADGTVSLVPGAGNIVRSDDRLIVLAERGTDEVSAIGSLPDPTACRTAQPAPLSVVMIGWSRVGALTLDRLADYLPVGSRVDVLADTSMSADGMPPWTWSLDGSFIHTKHEPDEILAAIERVRADAVAVLGYSDGMSEAEADALTLLTLLMLNQPDNRKRIPAARIVAHLFDSRLHPLAKAGGDDDFVVTDALASRMLVHTSRHPSMGDVYADLFSPGGPIVDVVPAPPGRTSYGAAAAGLVAEGMVPIGTIVDGKVALNPSRSACLERRDDRIVVVRREGSRSSSPGDQTA
jgi:voltage-gated potassium channel Kch